MEPRFYNLVHNVLPSKEELTPIDIFGKGVAVLEVIVMIKDYCFQLGSK